MNISSRIVFPYLTPPSASVLDTNSGLHVASIVQPNNVTLRVAPSQTSIPPRLAQQPKRGGINKEYVWPNGILGSVPRIYQGLRYKSGPIHKHLVTATQIMGAAFLASLALDLPGKDELAAAIFMLLAPPYALTFSTKAKETNVGHYELKQTVAGHAYRVWNPATESELRIDPSDQVLEIHLNNKKLGKTVNEAKGQSAREVFTGVMANERESLLSEIQKILSENPQIKAIRLTTPLDPIYFSWAQDFMIDEYHLSENAERKPSRLKQLLASLIHLSSTQLHPITTGRYMRFMVQRTLKALINQPYPMRTYMIPAEKISQITP